MAEQKFIRNIPRSIHRRVREFLEWEVLPYPFVYWLDSINRSSSAPIIAPGGPEVSITSYGKRIHTVHLTIESIGRGTLLPSRIALWLDDSTQCENLPAPLLRLQKRGLEILPCENYGPHKKYYPYVSARESFSVPMVTGDDDQLYPKWWLAKLVEANRSFPDCVNAHFAKRVQVKGRVLDAYATWKKCTSTAACFSRIAIGVSGIIYPPGLLAALKQAGTGFRTCCPKADDLWLHVQAVRAGYKIRQVAAKPMEFLQIPGTQEQALWQDNCAGAGNDSQIQATYTDREIAIFLQETVAG